MIIPFRILIEEYIIAEIQDKKNWLGALIEGYPYTNHLVIFKLP